MVLAIATIVGLHCLLRKMTGSLLAVATTCRCERLQSQAMGQCSAQNQAPPLLLQHRQGATVVVVVVVVHPDAGVSRRQRWASKQGCTFRQQNPWSKSSYEQSRGQVATVQCLPCRSVLG